MLTALRPCLTGGIPLCRLAKQTQKHHTEASGSYEQASSLLSGLAREADTQLRQNVAVDLPTGQTPVKRTWPSVNDERDVLDQERNAVLAHIKKSGPIPTSAEDTSGMSEVMQDRRGDRRSTSSALLDEVAAVSKDGGGAGASAGMLGTTKVIPRQSSALAARKASRRSSVLAPSNPLQAAANVRRI